MNPYAYYMPIPYCYQYPARINSGYPDIRQIPAVNPQIFMTSAKDMDILLKDASLVLAKMAKDKKFSYELINAAQLSKQETVEKMIKSIGTKFVPKVKYTPDGLTLTFNTGSEYQDCCSLVLKLRWG